MGQAADSAAATFKKHNLQHWAISLLSLRFGFFSRKVVVITIIFSSGLMHLKSLGHSAWHVVIS